MKERRELIANKRPELHSCKQAAQTTYKLIEQLVCLSSGRQTYSMEVTAALVFASRLLSFFSRVKAASLSKMMYLRFGASSLILRIRLLVLFALLRTARSTGFFFTCKEPLK
jgi:hypothetical protein